MKYSRKQVIARLKAIETASEELSVSDAPAILEMIGRLRRDLERGLT